MRLVVIESPYAGEIETNVTFARACIKDSLRRGESPIASHLLYTQPGILSDQKPASRNYGLRAGWAWYRSADACVVYVDRGISGGMKQGIEAAELAGVVVEYRTL